MAYGTINADVIQTSTSGGILGAGNASIMKNRIINGAMVIDQRNAGASTTPTSNATYVLDRWNTVLSQASKYSVQQNAGSVTPPVGFTNYLGITSLSAYSSGSTDYFSIRQMIEGFNVADLQWGTANAKTVTLSFWVYSSLTGSFSGSILNSAENRSYPFSFTVSSANTWTQASITIAGDTTGTWLTTNGVGMEVLFNLGSGSAKLSTANSWQAAGYLGVTGSVSVIGTSGATFYITGVQLEVGSSATGFEYRQYGQELALCQRYYYKLNSNGNGRVLSGFAYSTTLAIAGANFPVPMRIAPTSLEQDGTAGNYNVWFTNTRSSCSSVPVFNSSTLNNSWVTYTVASTLTAGQAIAGGFENAGASYLAWSAEL